MNASKAANEVEGVVVRLKETRCLTLYAALALSGSLPSVLLVFRGHQYDSIAYGFLGWNLILAVIPFAISQWLALFPPNRPVTLALGLFFWMLFFPNAPYLVTDLMHLSAPSSPVPFWFDLILLLSFAWNGLMLGFLSLLQVHSSLDSRFGVRAGWAFACAALVLGSLGIYVGRFLRWNSWDLLFHPASVLSDVSTSLLHPFEHPSVYAVTAAFSAFLVVGYVLLRALIEFATTLQLAPREGPG